MPMFFSSAEGLRRRAARPVAAPARPPRRWFRRAPLALVVPAVVAGLSLVPSPPAEAWPNDAGVTVDGFATCSAGSEAAAVPADAIWIYLDDTGEIEQASVDAWTRYFEVRFGNVPSSGSWGEVWIYCSVPGVESGWRFAGSTWISRPWITTTALPIWASA